MAVDMVKVIVKIQNGEALDVEEQAYINKKLDAQRKAEDSAKKAQAKMNLLLAYARKHYEPTEEEISAEVKRVKKA